MTLEELEFELNKKIKELDIRVQYLDIRVQYLEAAAVENKDTRAALEDLQQDVALLDSAIPEPSIAKAKMLEIAKSTAGARASGLAWMQDNLKNDTTGTDNDTDSNL